MSVDFDQLAARVLSLPTASRAQLADRLLDSLAEGPPVKLDDESLAVVLRRRTELITNQVVGISADEVFADFQDDDEPDAS